MQKLLSRQIYYSSRFQARETKFSLYTISNTLNNFNFIDDIFGYSMTTNSLNA